MPNDNANNKEYDTSKEIMKINNIDVSEDKWDKGIIEKLNITKKVGRGKDNTRDYKQLNLNFVKKEI